MKEISLKQLNDDVEHLIITMAVQSAEIMLLKKLITDGLSAVLSTQQIHQLNREYYSNLLRNVNGALDQLQGTVSESEIVKKRFEIHEMVELAMNRD
ncbi:hypothetical protein [Cecembia rubra]|uniref:Uncharacterized protein n=1 Tax=Cecembia rubra TaxID=1485585 RepID=A0A2P8EAS3_9BACT|nr:hypothetical protein [Cecembia rubra]PSL06572.1 hypothetical protein CLV48_102389 [Cecembia rubra]